MQSIDTYDLYRLAKLLSNLAEVESEIPAVSVYETVLEVDQLLKGLFVRGIPFEVLVSFDATRALWGVIEKLKYDYLVEDRKLRRPAPDVLIDVAMWDEFRKRLAIFEASFSQEARRANTFYIPAIGAYHVNKLIDNGISIFPVAISQRMDQDSVNDWNEASKCLALRAYTSCGFHCARAVERVVRSYLAGLGKNYPENDRTTWRKYSEDLESIHESNTTLTTPHHISQMLGMMAHDYRNPIMHPRIFLNESDAFDIWNRAQSIIIAMLKD